MPTHLTEELTRLVAAEELPPRAKKQLLQQLKDAHIPQTEQGLHQMIYFLALLAFETTLQARLTHRKFPAQRS
ncbi:MAG: hypothetical protein A3E85_02250 [Gammaproteobacteria bacterium RIFCSPHIGHO2_12_FULL_45_12]|nr:MAG: hypothetical protein A3E85_02250 [Gammaproteobacteria bacterium RIFCSPHIGHO2_12_FULL_45_12]